MRSSVFGALDIPKEILVNGRCLCLYWPIYDINGIYTYIYIIIMGLLFVKVWPFVIGNHAKSIWFCPEHGHLPRFLRHF